MSSEYGTRMTFEPRRRVRTLDNIIPPSQPRNNYCSSVRFSQKNTRGFTVEGLSALGVQCLRTSNNFPREHKQKKQKIHASRHTPPPPWFLS